MGEQEPRLAGKRAIVHWRSARWGPALAGPWHHGARRTELGPGTVLSHLSVCFLACVLGTCP